MGWLIKEKSKLGGVFELSMGVGKVGIKLCIVASEYMSGNASFPKTLA